MRTIVVCAFLLFFSLLSACRREEVILYSQQERVDVASDPDSPVVGFYVLNSGVKGSNEATLDYFDYTESVYHRNIYAERNTGELPNLGDYGLDIAVAAGKLYVTLCGSHRLEIFDAFTTQRQGTIEINNPRRILIHGDYVYVTSYLRQKKPSLGRLPLGELVRVNTTDISDIRRISLGFQPDNMVLRTVYSKKDNLIVDSLQSLLIANTGEYNSPKFDNRISVVNLDKFVQTGFIRTGTSPHSITLSGGNGRYLYVATHGNQKGELPKLHILEDKTQGGLNFFEEEDGRVKDIPIRFFSHCTDTLFMIQGAENAFGEVSKRDFVKYGLKADDIVERFVTDGTEAQIENPTSVAVHPVTHEIFITDARRGTSSGFLYCYSPHGRQLWKVKTGIVPCKIAFVYKQ